MLARTLKELGCACENCRRGSHGCETNPDGKIPVGTVVDHPDVWRLVRLGVAESEDDECAAKANMTTAQLAEVQRAARRSRIHPDDYDAFERGEMVGYYDDGSPVPGPNATRSEGGIILDGWDSDV
jgi:hypothetical protein